MSRVVRLTLDALEAGVRPGVTTADLDAIAMRVLTRHGATSAPAEVYGFPGTVLISVNDEVVHGIPGPRRIKDGDLVKLDVTAALDGYVSDAARTVIADDTGSDTAQRLRECAVAAFERALPVARAGNPVNAISREIEREVHARGFRVARGLDGHGVGRTIHEPPRVPNSYDPAQSDVLTDGLVLTIEPIVTSGTDAVRLARDGWTVRTRDGGLAAHHEHTIVITHGQPVVLTAA